MPHWKWCNDTFRVAVVKFVGLCVLFYKAYTFITTSFGNFFIIFVTYPGSPVCSIRLAMSTSFDQMSYCHLHSPIKPPIILPECTPIRMSIFRFLSLLKTALHLPNLKYVRYYCAHKHFHCYYLTCCIIVIISNPSSTQLIA